VPGTPGGAVYIMLLRQRTIEMGEPARHDNATGEAGSPCRPLTDRTGG